MRKCKWVNVRHILTDLRSAVFIKTKHSEAPLSFQWKHVTEKHALLVFVESNFTQNTLKKHALTGCFSQTSLRTHWKTGFTVCVESNFTQTHWKTCFNWCLLSQTSLRTHWKTCFTGVWVELHSEHTEKHALNWCLVKLHSEHTEKLL